MNVEIVELGRQPRGWKPADVRYVMLTGDQDPFWVAGGAAMDMGKRLAAERGYDRSAKFGMVATPDTRIGCYSSREVGVQIGLYII